MPTNCSRCKRRQRRDADPRACRSRLVPRSVRRCCRYRSHHRNRGSLGTLDGDTGAPCPATRCRPQAGRVHGTAGNKSRGSGESRHVESTRPPRRAHGPLDPITRTTPRVRVGLSVRPTHRARRKRYGMLLRKCDVCSRSINEQSAGWSEIRTHRGDTPRVNHLCSDQCGEVFYARRSPSLPLASDAFDQARGLLSAAPRCVCRHALREHNHGMGRCGALVDPIEGDTCECDGYQAAAVAS